MAKERRSGAAKPRKRSLILSARTDELLSLEATRLQRTRSEVAEAVLAAHYRGVRVAWPGDSQADEAAA